jgi:hypothetical protein
MYKNVMDAIEKRIQPTTKNDLGVDYISRQDVLSEIIRFSTEEGSSVECQQLYCDVNNMPSVTPQEPRWIPTSERLPKEDGEYYATIYDTDENYQYMDIAELEDGIWQYKDYIKVLAWQPLPKAYREVEE